MKVFLSSTYNDLIEHRKAAHDALEKLGLHVIRMEAFGGVQWNQSKPVWVKFKKMIYSLAFMHTIIDTSPVAQVFP